MKLLVFVLVGTLLAALKSSAKAEFLEKRPCRVLDNSLSRCLEEPVSVPESQSEWCPYRLCATSYGPGLKCPPLGQEKHKASDECWMKEKTVSAYKCIRDGKKRTVKIPSGCIKNCKEMPACECRKETERQIIWIQSERINPTCEDRSAGPIEKEEYAEMEYSEEEKRA